jgi:hypothetical protein
MAAPARIADPVVAGVADPGRRQVQFPLRLSTFLIFVNLLYPFNVRERVRVLKQRQRDAMRCLCLPLCSSVGEKRLITAAWGEHAESGEP